MYQEHSVFVQIGIEVHVLTTIAIEMIAVVICRHLHFHCGKSVPDAQLHQKPSVLPAMCDRSIHVQLVALRLLVSSNIPEIARFE